MIIVWSMNGELHVAGPKTCPNQRARHAWTRISLTDPACSSRRKPDRCTVGALPLPHSRVHEAYTLTLSLGARALDYRRCTAR